MSLQYYGAIATLHFDSLSSHLFEEMVEDIDVTFQPYGLDRCSSSWPCENVAIIERDSLRIMLGLLDLGTPDGASTLVFCVGHTTNGGNLLVSRETCEFVSEILLGHLESYLKFETVFQVDATQPVDVELIRTVSEILELEFEVPNAPDPQLTSEDKPRSNRALTRDILLDVAEREEAQRPAFRALNDAEDDELSDEVEIQEEISLPKRLTIYALGATMLIYTPPVGASLLVYTTLRDLSSPRQIAA